MRTLFGSNEFHAQPTPFGVHILHAEDGVVVIADRDILLQGMYSRDGVDLVITTADGSKYIVRGFFLAEHPPELTDGAAIHIPGDQAAAFAGPITRDEYAGTPANNGTSVGQVRTADGVITCMHPNGTTVTLKVGDLIYMGDIITTEAGGHLGLVFVDGMSLALGENGDLVIDELIYRPGDKGGKAALTLVSGAAEFVSGTIAHSGQDNMVFKTPVGTIGIRGTKVFVSFDPVSGNVSIINRPTGTDPQGNVTAGEIFLSLPNGTPIGSITSGNGGWQWAQGQAPQAVQLTEAQVQNVVAAVEATVNNLATQAPPVPQAPPGAGGQGAAGGQGGQAIGDAAQGGDAGGQAGGDGGEAPAPTVAPTPPTTQNTGPQTPTTTAATTPTSNFGTSGSSFGAPQQSIPTPPASSSPISVPPVIPVTPLPPAQLQPSEFSVTVDSVSPVDKTATTITFTITRTTNTTTPATVNFSTQGGSATAGQDFTGASGTLVFAAGETSKTVSVTILANSRTELAENFTFVVTPDAGAIVPNGTITISIPADPPLPTLGLTATAVTVTDTTAGAVTLTITRTGDATLPSTVAYNTVAGTAAAGTDFSAGGGTVTFAAGETTKTITIPILANSTPLTFANQEVAETFTVVLSNPVDATLTSGGETATITIAADPTVGLANFTIDSASAKEGDTVTLVVHRAGDLIGEVSVNYTVPAGTRNPSSTGKLTFAAGEISKTIVVPITKDTVVHPAETVNVVLSNPEGATIAQGTGAISIATDVNLIGMSISGTTVGDAVASIATVLVVLSGPSTETITVNFATAPGTAVDSVDYIGTSGTLAFAPGEVSKTIQISIPAQPSKTTSSTFSVVLSNPSSNVTLGETSAIVTILGNHINNAPTAFGAALVPTITPGETDPSGAVITTIIGSRFVDVDGDAMSGIAIIANGTTTEGIWQYSSNNGVNWVDVESAPATPPNTSPQVISSSSLLRFVPAPGFFGAAPPLIVSVMDNTYLSSPGYLGFSNSATDTPVTLSSPTSGGTSYLSSIFLPIQGIVMLTTAWDGGGGSSDWTVAANWADDVLPTGARIALLSGVNVTLQNNVSNNIGFLRLTNSAALTIGGGTTVLRTLLGTAADVGTTLSLYNGQLANDQPLVSGGTINIGQVGVSTGTIAGTSGTTNIGTLNANQGSIGGVTNAGLFSVVDSAGLFSILGSAINTLNGTLLIKAATTNAQLTVASPQVFQNSGLLQLTSVGNFEARLDITGVRLINNGTGIIQLDAGGGGQRIISGDLYNLKDVNLVAGTIKVNTTQAVFENGTLLNQGILNIASGKQFTIAAGAHFIQGNSDTTALVGSGVAASSGTPPGVLSISDGADFSAASTTYVPLGFGITVGTLGGIGGAITGGSLITVNGGINMLSGIVNAPLFIAKGTGTNPGGFLRASGDGTVTLNGAITVEGATSPALPGSIQLTNFDNDLYVTLNGSITNAGNIAMWAVSTDMVTLRDAVFDFSHGSFTNTGVFTSAQLFTAAPPGGTAYASGLRTLIGSMSNSGLISIQASTLYTGGTLTNSGSILISNLNNLTTSTVFGFGSGATFAYNGGSLTGHTANGPGASVLAFTPGSALTVNANMTIGTGLVLSIGGPEGAATVTGSSAIQVQGGIMAVGNANIVPTVNVNAGGTLNATNNGLVSFGTLSVNDDGTTPNTNGGIFNLQSAGGDVSVKVNTALNNTGKLNFVGGATPRDIVLDLSSATFSNGVKGQLNILSSTGGGQRTIKLPSSSGFYNLGAITISADTRFIGTSTGDLPLSNVSGATYTIQNNATVDYFFPTMNSLANQTGGIFTIGSGSSLNMHGGGFSNLGTLVVNGFIDMGGGTLENSSVGTISGSGTIFMGGGTFTNNGTSSITPGNSPGHMTIDGNAVFGANSHTQIQLAGIAVGQFDVLDVTQHFTMGGSLDVQSYDGFLPQAGDSFRVMTWNDASGFFDKATGLVMPNGVALDPMFDDHGLTLTARTITHRAGEGDVTLVGTDQSDVMVAGNGNDTLIAKGGNDFMIGGSGHTTFVVGSGNDHIVGGSGTNAVDFSETTAANIDLSAGTASTDLGAHHMILGVDDVIGSNASDTVVGNARDNVLTGGLGHDILTGGQGHDMFVLNSPVEGGDTITDFTSGQDSIGIDATAFGLAAGSCRGGENFSIIAGHFDGTAAGANTAFAAGQSSLIYSAADHTLYFDGNGSSEGYTTVATLQPGAILSAADIKIVDHHALV